MKVVPTIGKNLLSIDQLTHDPYVSVTFNGSKCTIEKCGKIMKRAIRGQESLYITEDTVGAESVLTIKKASDESKILQLSRNNCQMMKMIVARVMTNTTTMTEKKITSSGTGIIGSETCPRAAYVTL